MDIVNPNEEEEEEIFPDGFPDAEQLARELAEE